ncbi:MAG: GNAT family N-acetyltransferase [Phycisphaerales bacterium]|nr:GNAT family N-acetyltransferase [Phycisphaerales bacterium]
MPQVRRITRDDPLYEQECELREDVLLRPLGLSLARFHREFPGVEERFEHFVAVTRDPARGHRVIGCATLLPDTPRPGSGKLMQMAVNLQRQGEGIGRQLVVAVESRAFRDLGLSQLFCHARVPVVGFYESLGWQPDGEVFLEVGIPHRRMTVRRPEMDDGVAF